MAEVAAIPSVQRTEGIVLIPETKLPASAQGITIAIERTGLPEGPVAEVSIEGFDGKNWEGLGGCTLNGGVALGRDGKELLETSYTVQFTDPTGKVIVFPDTYLVRGTVKLLQAIKAGVEIRIF